MKFDDLRRASLWHLYSWCIKKVRRLAPTAFFQSFIPDEQSLSEWLPDIFWPKAIQGAQKAESVEQEYLSQLHLSSQVTLYLLPFVKGNEYCRFSGVDLEPRIVFFCVSFKDFPIYLTGSNDCVCDYVCEFISEL